MIVCYLVFSLSLSLSLVICLFFLVSSLPVSSPQCLSRVYFFCLFFFAMNISSSSSSSSSWLVCPTKSPAKSYDFLSGQCMTPFLVLYRLDNCHKLFLLDCLVPWMLHRFRGDLVLTPASPLTLFLNFSAFTLRHQQRRRCCQDLHGLLGGILCPGTGIGHVSEPIRDLIGLHSQPETGILREGAAVLAQQVVVKALVLSGHFTDDIPAVHESFHLLVTVIDLTP